MEQFSVHGYDITLLGRGNRYATGRPDAATSVVQVHSAHTVFVTSQHHGLFPVAGDAMIGRKWINVLSVYTADCQMIAILGRQYFTVVHAWRRGLHKAIIQQAVKQLYRQGEAIMDMHVVVGPAIHGASYEVGETFSTLFPEQYFFRRWEKRHFRIEQYTLDCLLGSGIVESHIMIHPDCTFQQHDTRYSRRRWDKARNRLIVQ